MQLSTGVYSYCACTINCTDIFVLYGSLWYKTWVSGIEEGMQKIKGVCEQGAEENI